MFKYGMKRDFNAWLASLGDRAPVKTLDRAARLEPAHEAAGTLKYGQAQLDISDEMDLQADRARYQADRAKDVALAGREGIDAALSANDSTRCSFPATAARRSPRRPATRP